MTATVAIAYRRTCCRHCATTLARTPTNAPIASAASFSTRIGPVAAATSARVPTTPERQTRSVERAAFHEEGGLFCFPVSGSRRRGELEQRPIAFVLSVLGFEIGLERRRNLRLPGGE